MVTVIVSFLLGVITGALVARNNIKKLNKIVAEAEEAAAAAAAEAEAEAARLAEEQAATEAAALAEAEASIESDKKEGDE